MTDNAKYLNYNWSWPKCFTQSVPMGYPFFLKVLGSFDPLLNSLPYIQTAIILCSIYFLFCTMRKSGYGAKLAFWISAPLLLAPNLLINFYGCNPECFSGVGAILIVALIIKAQRDKRWRTYMALGLVVFLTYQMRVIMVSLIPLVLLFCRDRRAWIAMTLPFIAFCLLRFAVVNDFAICSDGGIQSVGYFMPFFTQVDIPKVDPEVRDLAQAVVNHKSPWREDILPRKSDRWFYLMWKARDEYEAFLWPILGAKRNNDVVVNKKLKKLAFEAIRLHPLKYIELVTRGFLVAIQHWPDPIATFLLVFSNVGIAFRKRFLPVRYYEETDRRWVFFCLIGFAYFFINVLMLVSVTGPDDRYLHLCYLFIPSILISSLYQNWPKKVYSL